MGTLTVPVYNMTRPRNKRTGRECFGFQWIGQSLSSCDGCGRPYWEHTHMQRSRNGRWLRQVIRADERIAVKTRWERN